MSGDHAYVEHFPLAPLTLGRILPVCRGSHGDWIKHDGLLVDICCLTSDNHPLFVRDGTEDSHETVNHPRLLAFRR